MKQEPPLDAKCRDKFLVQSVIITADKEFSGVSQIVGFSALCVEHRTDLPYAVGLSRTVGNPGKEDPGALAPAVPRIIHAAARRDPGPAASC